MALREEFEASGQWLFRWRGYLPLVAVALVIVGLRHYRYLAGDARWEAIWQLACVLVSVAGLAVRAYTVGHAPRNTSGRNARAQRADELNTTGIYSLVRHPLYLGNFLVYLGVVSFSHQPYTVLVCVLAYWLYYERIMFAEEAFLRGKFGAAYEQWAARTPAIVPDFRNWTPPPLAFSLRNVLRREYNNAFGVVLTMYLFAAVASYFLGGRVAPPLAWNVALAVGGVAWLVLRTLKRNTEWLRVEGR